MSEPATAASGSTPEQLHVITRPADSYTLLIAPAGTGKTHTLVHRLDHLLDEELAADEVLMLSFSRAAVRELATRARSSSGRGRFVTARTFDAWALELLNELYAGQDWQSLSFDERIREATAAILDGHTEEYTSSVQHVLLDEVQDLVGDRRRLVEALLDSLDCGFTMVGDPAQAIYGFQTRGQVDGLDIFTWVRECYAGDLVELTLTHDFRARTPRPAGLLQVGAALRAPGASTDAHIARRVRDEFLDVPSAGGVEDVVDGLAYLDGDCAILCGDNGQALEASAALHEKGVGHRLQRRAGDDAAPRWLASLFRDHAGYIDRAVVADRTELTGDAFDAAWDTLLSVARTSSGQRLDPSRLRTVLAHGRLPRQVTTPEQHAVTVSSMHRAKGLEWDRVYILERRHRDDEDPMEEARLLYMALTRCRDDVFRLDTPAATGLMYTATRFDRWGRYLRHKRGARLGFALEGGDVDRESPAGTVGFTADPLQLQDYLAKKVRPGDPVVLSLCPEPVGDEVPVPRYAVEHDGRPIGVVSPSFRQALRRYKFGRNEPDPRWPWPVAITDCWVDDVETVAGSTAMGRRAGLGEYGVWLAPRLSGLSWFRYEKANTEADDE